MCDDRALALSAIVRETVWDAAVVRGGVGKACDGAMEGVRVRAAQLAAYARLVDAACEAGVIDGIDAVVAAAEALLSGEAEAGGGYVCVEVDAALECGVLADCTRMRTGVDASACRMWGPGTAYAMPTGVNPLHVCAIDECGEHVGCMEGSDVCVWLEGGGASVDVRISEEGVASGPVAQVGYVVDAGVGGVVVHVSVCGVALSPVEVPVLLADSVLLGDGHVPSEAGQAFVKALAAEWLPGCVYELLYRGSRGGMTPRAFHTLYDNQGATLVLIRSDNGFTFGGFSNESWRSRVAGDWLQANHAFLFSVVGPHGDVVKFPLIPNKARWGTVLCRDDYGPCFYDLFVKPSGMDADSPFGSISYCRIGEGFTDVLKAGEESLTGSKCFMPVDVEVFSVARPALP